MKVAFFDSHPFEREVFDDVSQGQHEIHYIESRLTVATARLAQGFPCICAFVSDSLSAEVLKILHEGGTKLVALRSAGFNHVDLIAARELKIKVVRVPEYSPYAVAEHVVALILTLNRKTHRAFNRVREGNFSLNGLVGFDLHGKCVGVIGTGKIGKALVRILRGFGCEVLMYDHKPDVQFSQDTGSSYRTLDEIYACADIISLHVPLTPQTHHFINSQSLEKMKKGIMIINTGRGGLINTKALIAGLKSGHVGHAGLDVYEEEEGVFFQDLSGQILNDDLLARLMTFPNVLITSHQAFLTSDALHNIADTTLNNISEFEQGLSLVNEVSSPES